MLSKRAQFSLNRLSFKVNITCNHKGGESSSQLRWFTTAKIELEFLIFFVLFLGLQLQRYLTNTKRYPPKKVFGNSEFCSSRQNHSSLNNRLAVILAGRIKLRVSKIFFRGISFLFVEYKNGSTVRFGSLVRYGTLVRYAVFVKVRVRYVGMLF